MDNIIEELISIEGQAHELMSRTLDEQRDLALRIRAETDKIKNRIEKEASQKIKAMYDKAYAESQERVNRIITEAGLWHEDTKRVYDENCGKWEQEIFDRITGQAVSKQPR